ncbi:tyrosine-type recombinase/integrase [Ruegeria arenilitoris]|uniref:tyrosine-type recombinase/integrase n=1 Tax=Ruegeria arenilitoris TaxID=1173585 RepID=UPI00147C1ECF|nr:tyrosine-type recombinase/integrase [Ruegeria arenilitoris]
MSDEALPARERALKHLIAARDTNVRGELAEAIKAAISIADGSAVKEAKRSDRTDISYQSLKPGGKLTDPQRAGLMMRATKGKQSRKTWIFRFSDPETRKQVEYIFGTYPEMTLADARSKWRDLRDLRDKGEDPRPKSKTNGSSTEDVVTVGALCQRYLSEYARKVKAETSVREDTRIINRHILPDHGDKDVREFTEETVASILLPLSEAGKSRQAEQVASLIHVMFNVAVGKTKKIDMLGQKHWLPKDHPNPAANPGLKKREVMIAPPSKSVFRSFIRNIDVLGRYGDILMVQAETFARINEVTGMRWAEVDFEDAVWELPAERSKNGFSHKVMLSRQTVARLEELKGNSESIYVFPSAQDASKPIDKKLVIRTLKKKLPELGIDSKFTSHALRRMALTWVAENKGHKEIRDRLSNHTSNKKNADAHYSWAAERNDVARQFTQLWSDHLCALSDEKIILPAFGGQSA